MKFDHLSYSLQWRYLRYVAPFIYRFKYRRAINECKIMCLFIGYPRSGHTLVGQIIDAHPNAVLSPELNILKAFRQGQGVSKLLAKIICESEWFRLYKNKWTGYSYHIPGASQGRFDKLMVIGDKEGVGTLDELEQNFDILDSFARATNMELRFIHVVRNPLDNIATRITRHLEYFPNSDEDAIQANFVRQHLKEAKEIAELVGRLNVLTVHNEALISSPAEEVARIFTFLDLAREPSIVDACASIVFKKEKQTRNNIEWKLDSLELIAEVAKEIPFLNRYVNDVEKFKSSLDLQAR